MKQREFEELLKINEIIVPTSWDSETFFLSGTTKFVNVKHLYELFNSEIIADEKIIALTRTNRFYEVKVSEQIFRGIIILTNKELVFLYVNSLKDIQSDFNYWKSDSFKLDTIIDIEERPVSELIIKTPKENYSFSIDDPVRRRIYRLIENCLEEIQEQKNMSEKQVSKYDLRNSNIGNFADIVQSGGKQQNVQNIYTQQQKRTLAEAAVEIQTLIKQLEKTNPTATEVEKVAYINRLLAKV